MGRSSRWSCAWLLAVALMTPGCATVVLWDWAGQEETPGQLAGILRDGRGGDMVVYRFDRGATLGVRIPSDWRNRPLRAVASSPQGDALALVEPLQPMGTGSLPSEDATPLRALDYKTTIGPQGVAFTPGERPFGFVALMTAKGEVLHELYGYEFDREQWILLATVNLGGYQTDTGRMVTGVALTPVTVALDFAIFCAVICAIGHGGNVSGLDFPSLGGDPPRPVYVRERDRYWRSLQTASPPAGR